MARNLVIVESPAKAGTIEKYLGSDYQVLASFGHVRDLPSSKIGVDVENGFEPSYVIPVKAKKTITGLKNAIKDKEMVLLATDPDREGEAISWHVYEALGLDKQKAIKVKRITFEEITKTAVLHAVANPRELDIKLIDAQQARRVLDRLVGYTLSPVLWKKIYKGLSAGRVQSVALRLIVERERERNAFKPVEYWSIDGQFSAKEGEYLGQLVKYQGQKIEQLSIKSQDESDKILANLRSGDYQIESIEEKQTKRRPYAPYTTSTLQQDGVNKLSMSAKRIMSLAQELYEEGHITYMRTDSTTLSADALVAIRAYVTDTFGANYIPEKSNVYQTKTKNAQEAHEAIRPTNASKELVSNNPSAQKLYELIRRRAIASQMKDAELLNTTVMTTNSVGTFKSNGQRVIFPGFLAVWRQDEKEDKLLPKLNKQELVKLLELKPEQHFTEPPAKFTEASLIKALEEQGIGRPSTYAPTIDTLISRNYVILDQRRFTPQEAGYLVTDLLVEHFPEIVDVAFTAKMEEQLDDIAEGSNSYKEVLSDFWTPFAKNVKEKTDSIVKINTDEETDEKCPECGSPMVIKMGRFGKFLACSNFPDCKTTKPINKSNPTLMLCPVCGKDLVEKRARRGVFFGCSGYPACNFALWKKEHLPAKMEALELEGQKLEFKAQAEDAFLALCIDPLPLPKARIKKDDTKSTSKTKSGSFKKTKKVASKSTKTTKKVEK